MIWLWAAIVILSLITLSLCIKIYLMRKSLREIERDLRERLTTDTNVLIDISSGDKYVKKLAVSLNYQLKKLREERRRFQQGDLELKEAVTNISHDLRTPLTAICGYLDLLEREEKSDSVQRYIAQIENRTEVLKQLTEELFRYSVVASVREKKTEKTDLRRVLEESLVSFYGAMQRRGITPQIDITDTPVIRQLDSSAANRIFGNIISNALKYSDGDFAVTMSDNGEVVFSNTARGLDAVTVGKLFDRFYTVETGRSSTGLGLSIAKLLTERMNGEITAFYENERLYIKLCL